MRGENPLINVVPKTARKSSITVDALSYTYGTSNTEAVSQVSFSAAEGSYIAIAGHNGSGKTTLAKCIAGLLHPTAGEVVITADTHGAPEAGLLFQNPQHQILAETAELDIALSLENRAAAPDAMHRQVETALEKFSLASVADIPLADLTHDDIARLAFAGSTVFNPSVLIADEPTAALSPRAKQRIITLLRDYAAAGHIVLHITHTQSEMNAADRLLVMKEGRLVFDGLPQNFFTGTTATDADPYTNRSSLKTAAKGAAKGAALCTDDSNTNTAVCRLEHISDGSIVDFSHAFRKGTITAICGEAGSGKTRLLEIIAGLHTPESGTHTVDSSERLVLSTQNPEDALFEEFVADDVAYALTLEKKPHADVISAVKNAMETVGLSFEKFKNRKTYSLSGGEKRRAAFAGLLVMQPTILLLDAPTSGLDESGCRTFQDIITQLKNNGVTIILTSPTQSEAAYADVCICLPPSKKAALYSDNKSQDSKKRYSGGYPLFPLLTVIITGAASIIAQSSYYIAAIIFAELLSIMYLTIRTKKTRAAVVKKIIIPFITILPWIILVMIIQYVFRPDVSFLILFFLRFASIYMPVMGFLFFIRPTAFMHGIEDLLFPLKIIGVPIRNLSFLIVLIIRFIDILSEESSRIKTAHRVRSGLNRKATPAKKIRTFFSLFIPLMLRTLARADILELALTARRYNDRNYSRYAQYRFSVQDVLLLCSAFGVLIFLF